MYNTQGNTSREIHGLSVGVEVDLVVMWVVEIDLVSVWANEHVPVCITRKVTRPEKYMV